MILFLTEHVHFQDLGYHQANSPPLGDGKREMLEMILFSFFSG